MPKFKVEPVRVVTDREGADVVVEAADADEARRLALWMYEGDEDGEIEFAAYEWFDWGRARTGAVEEFDG